MSKIGKKPILVPEGTIAVLKDGSLEIKGKNATKIVKLLPGVNAKIEDGEKNKQILLTADSRTKLVSRPPSKGKIWFLVLASAIR